MKKIINLLFVFILLSQSSYGSDSSILLQKGWDELIKDNDTSALKYFGLAYDEAKKENNIENSATALLNIGICSYGVSYSQGLHFCLLSMEEFKKLEKTDPKKALIGRSKCL